MPIFTTHKERLPDDLSYPVGLQTLATALADVPQAENLPVRFLACNGSVMEMAKERKEGGHYPILSVEFHHYRLGMSECHSMPSLYEPVWSLSVYGVTRHKRDIARHLLVDQGLASIAAWLKTPRSETWKSGKKKVTVSFSDEQETILITETCSP